MCSPSPSGPAPNAENRQSMTAFVSFVSLSPSTQALKAEPFTATERALDDSPFILGSEVEAFEHEFPTYCGAFHPTSIRTGLDPLALPVRVMGDVPNHDAIISITGERGACTQLSERQPAILRVSPPHQTAAYGTVTETLLPWLTSGQRKNYERGSESAYVAGYNRRHGGTGYCRTPRLLCRRSPLRTGSGQC